MATYDEWLQQTWPRPTLARQEIQASEGCMCADRLGNKRSQHFVIILCMMSVCTIYESSYGLPRLVSPYLKKA